jgi:hypothetical protein
MNELLNPPIEIGLTAPGLADATAVIATGAACFGGGRYPDDRQGLPIRPGAVQGVYRAFSFIGLGIVLIGIGLLYQRLLFPPRPQIPPEAASTSPQAG